MMATFLSVLTSYPYNILVSIIAIGSGGIFLLRQYVAGGVCRSRALLTGKTVIITGANTGIGLETAVDLAKRKARVILACRSVERGEKAAVEVRRRSGSEDVVFRQLNLASLTSVRQFAAKVLEKEPRIDILINNAGVMACPYMKTEDSFEMQFGVNHLSHFLLTNLLLERLKEAPAARIVNVSSSFHKHCPRINFEDLNSNESYDPYKAYALSKLANILFTRKLSRSLQGTTVAVNSLHPGVVMTELARYMLEGMSLLKKLCTYPVALLFFKTAWQGSQTTIYCAVAEELEGVSGKYFGDCHQEELSTALALDDEVAVKLWEASAQMVGLDT